MFKDKNDVDFGYRYCNPHPLFDEVLSNHDPGTSYSLIQYRRTRPARVIFTLQNLKGDNGTKFYNSYSTSLQFLTFLRLTLPFHSSAGQYYVPTAVGQHSV